jgi:hypothetical protein
MAELELENGEVLEVEECVRLYEALWSMAVERRGSVTAAGKVRRAQHLRGRSVEQLDLRESAAVRGALVRVGLPVRD